MHQSMDNYTNKDDSLHKAWWSYYDDSEEFSHSINIKFDSLCLNSSVESCDSAKISRGNPAIKKSVDPSIQIKHKTSKFVLQLMNDPPDVSSSNESSSISPTNDLPCLTTGAIDNKDFNICQPAKSGTKRMLEKWIVKRLKSRSHCCNSENFIKEFGESILMKACRTNNIEDVKRVLDLILKEGHIYFLDHKNMANETALLICVHLKNERLIEILLKKMVSPSIELSMGNNVLHYAAALVRDDERRIFGCLLQNIQKYQPHKLIETLAARNMFGNDPCSILQLCKNANAGDGYRVHCLERHISHVHTIFIMAQSNIL